MLTRSYRLPATFSIAFWLAAVTSSLATAQEVPECDLLVGSPDSCSPLVACMPGQGVYFIGRAIGWNTGVLGGYTSTGVACRGTWTTRNMLGLGEANFECDDGLSGTVYFYSIDGLTGTAEGSGLTNGLGRIHGWSGHNIAQFLDPETGHVDGALMCGPTPMLLS